MINESVKNWLVERGFADRLTEHGDTIDTVEHAAQQIGCSEAEIAKTLSFIVEDSPSAFRFFDHLPELKVMVYERPWNREAKLPGAGYVRCPDWAAIREMVGSI